MVRKCVVRGRLSFCGGWLVAVGGLAQVAAAAEPTFNSEVLPILRRHCQECHRPQGRNLGGAKAPMAFSTFEQVRPWADEMAAAVSSRRMPPWLASEIASGVFVEERGLSPAEIDLLVRWAAAGAPAGERPAGNADGSPGRGTRNWTLGPPDLEVALPEPYFVDHDVEDIEVRFHHTLTAAELPADRWIESVEFRVGSRRVASFCATVKPPHEVAAPTGSFQLGCTAHGVEPGSFPQGYGIPLDVGSEIELVLHYRKEAGHGTGFWDQSAMGLRFAAQDRGLKTVHIETLSASESFREGRTWTTGSWQATDESTLLALWPQGSAQTTAARVVLVRPDGKRTSLLEVPAFESGWQAVYRFRQPLEVAAGARVETMVDHGGSEGPATVGHLYWALASEPPRDAPARAQR